LHLLEAEDPLRPLVVVLGPLAALELRHRIDRDAASAGGLGEDDRDRLERACDRPALEPLAAHGGDEGGHVVAPDLVEPAVAEPGDQVLLERPGVDLLGTRADVLPFEQFAGVLLERLPGRLDPLAAAAAQEQLGALGLGVFEASVHDRPAALRTPYRPCSDTYNTSATLLRRTPSTVFSRTVSRWRVPSMTGTIRRPRTASCSISGGGTSAHAAVTQIRS
jgi:hypothetical protein